jgi:hypothetical protein
MPHATTIAAPSNGRAGRRTADSGLPVITIAKLPTRGCRPMRNRILPGILVILGVALSGLLGDLSRDVRAQPGWDFPEFDQAREAYRREDCRGAWDIVWPLAKKGNHEARYFLHGTIVDRMIPPGDSGYPRSVFLRHNLILAAYATLARARPGRGDPNHRWARIDIPNSINALASVKREIASRNAINPTLPFKLA